MASHGHTGTPFPTDQHGDEVPFGREEVEVPHSTWLHVWHGDARGGPHDPFGPEYRVGKTLFPRRWFGDSGASDYERAQDEIVAALRTGPARVHREGVDRWRIITLHDDVVVQHWIERHGGLPLMRAAWPINGAGVDRVVELSPLRLEHAGRATFPPTER